MSLEMFIKEPSYVCGVVDLPGPHVHLFEIEPAPNSKWWCCSHGSHLPTTRTYTNPTPTEWLKSVMEHAEFDWTIAKWKSRSRINFEPKERNPWETREKKTISTRPLKLAYMIEAVTTRKIKIGSAADPSERIKSLQTACPDELRLIATFAGGSKKERELQERFGSYHERGEWFSDCKSIRDCIQEESL